MNSFPKPSTVSLPRIACFHGGGSNSLVFASQCKRLQHMLAYEYEFVFFDAPFEREAGPGVLPYFADLGPFRTWMRPEFLEDDEKEGLKRVIQLMEEDSGKRRKEGNMDEEERKVGKWVGAMGFSQGTRVVGGLLRWMESVNHSDQQRSTYRDIDIQFGVLCMGSSKPMGYTSDTLSSFQDRGESSDIYEFYDDNDDALVYDTIHLPTLHLHGLRDAILPRSREQLALYYDGERSRLLEINYHHAMPWYTNDLMKFVAMFRDTHKMATATAATTARV